VQDGARDLSVAALGRGNFLCGQVIGSEGPQLGGTPCGRVLAAQGELVPVPVVT
jgi:hypothetical protein